MFLYLIYNRFDHDEEVGGRCEIIGWAGRRPVQADTGAWHYVVAGGWHIAGGCMGGSVEEEGEDSSRRNL